MKKIVVLTGAGVSAESGLATFRDSDGLWEGYKVEEVATPQGWRKNKEQVLEFYNQRRKQALNAKPNRAHLALAKLEEKYEVAIITQNIDELHEQAGSSNVLHLHGKLFESRSTLDENLIYRVQGWELRIGDKCEKGSQLRPNVVWFGEAVPNMEKAVNLAHEADVFIVIGTSLVVYPAASLIDYIKRDTPVFVIDPKTPNVSKKGKIRFISKMAGEGVPELVQELLDKA